jgi:hypothetical protein
MSDSSLYDLTIELTRTIVPIIIIFGTLGNILNIIVLTRRNLKGYACSIYFLGLSINNLFYSSIILICNLLLDGYGIDPSNYSNIYCKLISYLLNLCPNLSVYYIVLASIDRYCSSSINPEIRKLSRVKIARYLIILITIIVSLIMIGTLIAFDLRDDGFGCTSRSDSLFNEIFLFIEVILYVIIAPFLLILFGSLTIYNTTKIGQNRQGIFRYRRTEKQLAKMLILQVSTHVIFAGPFCAMYLMLILPIQFRVTYKFYLIYILCKIPFYLTFISPFFLYILSAKIYRDQLIILFKNIFQTHHQNTIVPIDPSLHT